MKLPLQISFEGVAHSDAVEAAVRKKAEKLDRFARDIMACRVAVGLPEKHKHQGKSYSVRIDLTVPGHELVSSRKQHEDVYVALRDAFNGVGRMLEEVVRKRRGEVKPHPLPMRGTVARLSADEGIGFIRSLDGTDYYFDRVNLVDLDFEQLAEGTQVQFIEEVAGEGPQAKRITLARQQGADGPVQPESEPVSSRRHRRFAR